MADNVKTQGSLVPPRLWLWLVPSPDGAETHIRKWSHAPFPEGVEYVPACAATPVSGMIGEG
jgi:formate dehydrogenase maturation protein FdhE